MLWQKTVGMASTLSTFKINFFLIGLLLVGGVSCSSSKQAPPSKGGKIIKRKAAPIDSGPSAKAVRAGFQDVTKRLGLDKAKGTHLYAVDWNNDGHTDLVTLPEYYGVPQFFKFQSSNKTFFKVETSPLNLAVRASFLVFADFNKDGLLDMIVGTLNQKTELNRFPLRLFLATKKKGEVKFNEVAGAFPKDIYPTASISLIDVDLDGQLDIFLGNWFDTTKSPPKPTPDRLFLGREKGRKWIDGTILLEGEHEFDSGINVFTNATPSFGSSTCDIDRNGYPDIMVASSSGYKNKAWLNLEGSGQRKFVNKAKLMKVDADSEGVYSTTGGGNSFYMLCHDYNSDGIFDLALGELFHSYDPETRDRSSILTGSSFELPPKFIRTEYHKDDGSGTWSQGDRRAVWGDFNFDSYPDLVVANSGFPPRSRLIFFEQDETHAYADSAAQLGIDIVNPSGVVKIDYNGDGRLDLFSGQVSLRNSSINPHIFVFENQFPYGNKKIIKVTLKGEKANAHGIGASLRLKTSRGEYLRNVEYSYGPLNSQNEEGTWFGLKEGEKPLSLEVRWPILIKSKRNRPYPLRRVYSLKSVKFKRFLNLELKESGKMKQHHF